MATEIILPLKTKYVKEELGNELNSYLSQNGFKYLKSKNSFLKKTDFGFQEIAIIVSGYWPAYVELGLVFSIRFDEIENTLSKFIDNRFGNYTKTGIKEWVTISTNIEFDNNYTAWDYEWIKDFKNFILEKKSLVITTEKNLEYAKNIFIQRVIETGFPFFNKYSNLEIICFNKEETYLFQKNNNWALTIHMIVDFLINLKLSKNKKYKFYKEEILQRYNTQKLNPKILKYTEKQESAIYDCIKYLDNI